MADTATLHHPLGITFAKDGILYFSDSTRIRKIDASGIISTVAGIATSGYSGDGGMATAAAMEPTAITFDTSGNMLIADYHRIRKVDKEGIITTIAGTGISSYNGDGIHPLLANIRLPTGIVVSSTTGEIFIGEMGNNRVRMISYTWNDIKDVKGVQIGVMRIVPNPCRDNCKLFLNTSMNERATIVVTDVKGIKVSEFEISTNQQVVIPAGHLPCGVYFVNATAGQQQYSCKWTIE